MKIIWVASKNRAKLEGARIAFERLFAQEEFAVICKTIPTGPLAYGALPEQPVSEEETISSAQTRLLYLINTAEEAHDKPDFFVAIEAGVATHDNGLIAFSWAVVAAPGQSPSYGRSTSFMLPSKIVTEIKKGHTLLEACKKIYPPSMGHNREEGLIALLSGGTITRTDQSAGAVMMALLEIKNPDLYN